jgi:putative peptide zinc metalloprotease protein
MLCRECHVQVRKDFPYCLSCGALRKGAKVSDFAAPELRWGEHAVPITAPDTSVGRTDETDVTIDHPSVSRRHARIVRDAEGFHVEDLGSLNGTAVHDGAGPERVLRGGRATLQDGTRVTFGDVEAVFGQPRTTAIGSKTQVRGTEFTMLRPGGGVLPEKAATATEPLSVRPVRRSGWALKQVPSTPGEPKWVLRNTRTNAYLSLDERQVFVWEQLDGRNTMRDLLFAYLERFGELALPRIEAAVRTFDQAGLVRGLPGHQPELTGWQRFTKFLITNLIRIQVAISGLDPLVERAYRAFGWRFFTRTGVALLWLLTLGGLYGFWVATGHQQLFDLAGAGPVGGVVTLAGYLVATAVHEAAHAFAVKSYGRRVNRGGFMVMLGMPFAFVDTSDMWFGSPYSRIVVALSGPLTTTGIAGAAALTAAYLPQPQIAGVAYTLAFGLYVNTLFNLIPIMPLDGYQALADALRTPRLKEEAKAYFAKGLWADLRARRRPGPKQVGFVVFALLSGVCLYAGVVMVAILWNSRLGDLLRDHVAQPWRTVIVTAGIALLLFPIYYPPLRKLRARLAKRPARRPEVPAGRPADAAHP